MTKTFRPMLAATGIAKIGGLPLPMYGSPKCDGFRMLVRDGKAWSRAGLLLPSPDVQRLFGRPEFEGLDGELVLGSPTDKDCFVKTESFATTESRNATGANELAFLVFDKVMTGPYEARLAAAQAQVAAAKCPQVTVLLQQLLDSEKDVKHMYQTVLKAGFEGLMLRSPKGPYKQGRSTHAEGYLLRLKPLDDSDAYVRKVIEMQHTDGSRAGTAGTLICVDMHTGVEFNMAVPRNHDWWWANREVVEDLGQDDAFALVVKYRFSASVGDKNKPRNPTLVGTRARFDLVPEEATT